MSKKKKKCICVISAIVILTAILTLIFCIPRRPFKDAEKFDLDNMRVYKIINNDEIDITDKVDLERLAKLLTLICTKRLHSEQRYYYMADRTYDMFIVYNHKPMRIVLENTGRSFANLDRGIGHTVWDYRIENDDAWNLLMELLIEE